MKFSVLLSAIFTVLACHVMQAQSHSVAGIVVDETNNAVPYANAALYTPDSVLVTGAVSDGEGHFIIPVKPGVYYIKV
jgi:hypothetical protein